MKWSWKIGRIAGIDVFMHWTFLLLLVWIGGIFLFTGQGILAAVQGIALILALFGCVVLHELGHALAARRYQIKTQDITLLPIGGVARLERIPEEPAKELVVAVAGPIVNVVIAAVLFAGLIAFGGPVPFQEVGLLRLGTFAGFATTLMWFNVFIVAFNLLPAFPMDGGRMLRALLATRMPHPQATEVAATVGQMMAVMFGIFGLFTLNPILLLIAFFVYMGATSEAQMVQTRSAIRGLSVRAGMMTHFHCLSPDDTLKTAADELLSGAQQDFPVIDESGLCGLLRRQDLVEGLKTGGREMRVGDVMTKSPQVVSEGDSLEKAVQVMREFQCSSIPVMHGSELVGLLTMENIGELIMLRSAIAGRGDVPQRPEEVTRAA